MNYSGINAKIKAMRGGLLNAADYESMTHGDSVDTVARRLSDHKAYKAIMSQLEGSEIHRENVESKIVMALSDEFSRIYNFVSDFNVRKYLNAYFLNFEFDILKKMLAMVNDERDIDYSVPELNTLIGNELKVDTAKLKASKNINEFIQNLQGTAIYSMLADKLTSGSTVFEIEMQMDLYYYLNLWKQQKLYLDRGNMHLMQDLIGTEIDMRNIMLVYRMKKNYSLNDERIYAFLIPISYKLRRPELVDMAKSKTMEELTEQIKNSPYANILSNFEHLELSYYNYMINKYKHAADMHPQSLAYTVEYVFLKQVEIRNIVSLLEGIRYKLNPKDIMSYINTGSVEEVS